ncbi:MAG TPA: hypothetical protein VMT50_05535 [Steroidobacteraceae bacterium]|nr:hypothetical protein [Steroidobacteraceae bacterium]
MKRGAWRKTAKITMWVCGGLVLAGTVAYLCSDRLAPTGAMQVPAAQSPGIGLFKPRSDTYWQIAIGMSPSQVRALKGEPTEIRPASPNTGPECWTYRYGVTPDNYAYDVYWNAIATQVAAVVCQGSGTGQCERLAGLARGSTEEEVRKALGVPSRDEPRRDRDGKRLSYDRDDVTLVFFLVRGSVDAIALKGKPAQAK